MKPDPTTRLKSYAWTSTNGITIHGVSNDAGDPSEEFDILEDLDADDARRLAACWNACREWSTEELEGKTVLMLIPEDTHRIA